MDVVGEVAILAQDASNGRCGASKLEGSVKHSGLDVLKHGLRRSGKPAQKPGSGRGRDTGRPVPPAETRMSAC